jgi:hypothetical protein
MEPDYQRPFETTDFRGYFTWDRKLSNKHGGRLYHACHPAELGTILDEEKLNLRSKWSLVLPEHGHWDAPGVWTGLNLYRNGNHYGPFLLEFPLHVLHGKRFMVFRRSRERKRYFFVQYEAQIPIYSFEGNPWRRIDPYKGYFKKEDSRAIWDIVLTQPLSIRDVVIRAVEHPSCIPRKCGGSTRSQNLEALRTVAKDQFVDWLKQHEDYEEFLARFQCARGMKVKLPDFDEDD